MSSADDGFGFGAGDGVGYGAATGSSAGADYGLLSPIWAGRPVATVTGDAALVDAMIEAELALARAQGVRITPPLADAATLAARARAGGNPVTPLLTALADPRLHNGATSQDILDTALMLTARRALTLAALDLDTAIAAATRLAATHRDTPMAARTLTQQAVPTTFGLKAAGWRHLLLTARQALTATAQSLPAQLGGAAGTLASFVAQAEDDVPYAPHNAPHNGSPERTNDAAETSSGSASGSAAEDSDSSSDSDLSSDSSFDTGTGTSSGSSAGFGSGQSTEVGTPKRCAAFGSRHADPASEQSADTEPERPLVLSSGRQSDLIIELLIDTGHGPTGEGLPSPSTAPLPGTGIHSGTELLTDSAARPGVESGQGDRAAVVQSPADAALALVGRYARILGLAEPLLPWHVLRVPIADLASSLALASGALGKIAADVLVLARSEIGEVAEGVGGVSSTMPHKANPVRAVMIAGAARQVPALASILFGSVAAEDERPAGAWHAEWQPLREALRLVGGSAATVAELLSELRVDPERMAANLAALDLAEARKFANRDVTDPRDYLGAAPALVDRALNRTLSRAPDRAPDRGPDRSPDRTPRENP
ncbi:hypothetical protein GCM10009839_31070 [Catenulispora yoronensis]|uniref:Fumarate lyase N-terminal domain-containing protein n=1 Tax=Catenulispora yoronensis TaxID=450799 RepID=A0ABP5FQM2_9ACTN